MIRIPMAWTAAASQRVRRWRPSRTSLAAHFTVRSVSEHASAARRGAARGRRARATAQRTAHPPLRPCAPSSVAAQRQRRSSPPSWRRLSSRREQRRCAVRARVLRPALTTPSRSLSPQASLACGVQFHLTGAALRCAVYAMLTALRTGAAYTALGKWVKGASLPRGRLDCRQGAC